MPVISTIGFNCEVKCDGLSREQVNELTVVPKEKCPLSRLVATAEIQLDEKLV